MKTTHSSLSPHRCTPLGWEIRYERSFLLDLQQLHPEEFSQVKQFVFETFQTYTHLQELPSFRPIDSSGIFYRFTFDRYLVSLEVMGQIVKFLRVLPIPNL